jgi:predicted O-linked N-acetylglucosamine transferase (SPINDLY family)
VGFLSSFFFHHSVGLLTRGVIRRLDRNKFFVATIFSAQTLTDYVSEEIAASADEVPVSMPFVHVWKQIEARKNSVICTT